MRFGMPSYSPVPDLLARMRNSRVFKASVWSVATLLITHTLRIGSNLIMTRLLAPEMFGVMSFVSALLITLALLSDIGLRTVAIQSHRDDPSLLNTVWTLEIIRGAGVWLLCAVAAAGLYLAGTTGRLEPGTVWSAPALPAVLAITTLSAVISALQSTNLLTAARNLQLFRVSIIELVAHFGGLLAMILAGVLTRSIWALVVGALVVPLLHSILSHVWLSGITNKFAWDREALGEIYRMGRWMLLSSGLFILSGNVDRFLLAGFVSASLLGVYSIGLTFVQMIDNIGGRLYSQTVLPALSAKAREDRQGFRRSLYRLRVPFDAGYLMAAGFIFVAGPKIIQVLYDDRYHLAGEILQVLSFSLVFSRYGIFPMAYIALGDPRWLAINSLVKLLSAIGSLLLFGYLFGFTGALYAVAFHPAATLVVMFMANRQHGLNNLRFEMLLLPAWLVGYGLGYLGLVLLRLVA